MPDHDLITIVVLGAMNPRIHHPYWYHLVGIITKEQADEALSSPGTFGISGTAQVQIPSLSLTIVCHEQSWEIRTDKSENLELLKKTTWKVFDELLMHTPVVALRTNFSFTRSTRCPDVSQFLADRAVSMGIGLAGGSASDALVILRRTFGDHKTIVAVQGSPAGKESVNVSSDYEYPVDAKGVGFFSLREKVAEKIERALMDAEEQTALVLRAINERGEVYAGRN
jgi:hypothetical protein